MKNSRKNKTFINAIKLIEEDIIQNIDSLPAEDCEPSEKMNAVINDIISDMQNKEMKKAHRYRISLVTSAITVILIVCLGCTPAVRKMIVNVYDKFVEFISGNNAKTEITELYEPTWLPEGYELELIKPEMPLKNTIIWNNGEYEIILKQTIPNQASIDIENSEYSIYETNNIKIYYSYKYNVYNLAWYNDDYLFNLYCSDSIEFNDVIKIINSMEIK